MARPREDGDAITCSFCRQDWEQVRKMVAGPDAHICDECFGSCHGLIADEVRAS